MCPQAQCRIGYKVNFLPVGSDVPPINEAFQRVTRNHIFIRTISITHTLDFLPAHIRSGAVGNLEPPVRRSVYQVGGSTEIILKFRILVSTTQYMVGTFVAIFADEGIDSPVLPELLERRSKHNQFRPVCKSHTGAIDTLVTKPCTLELRGIEIHYALAYGLLHHYEITLKRKLCGKPEALEIIPHKKPTGHHLPTCVILRPDSKDIHYWKMRSKIELCILEYIPDAIIIGPGFEDLTIEFCNGCDAASIPYAFVDSQIECTRPIASYTADQPEGGYIAGRILGHVTSGHSKIAVFSALNEGEAKAYNASRRLQGILEYFSDSRRSERLLPVCYVNMHDDSKGMDEIEEFITAHPDIEGVAVMNSRGHLVAESIAHVHKSHDIKIVAFDCTEGNRRCLLDGSISVILSQRPRQQGFQAVRSIIEYLLYKKLDHTQAFNLMAIDILLKENLKYYNN